MSTEQILDEENKEPLNEKDFLDAQHKKYLKLFLIIFVSNVVLYAFTQTITSASKLLDLNSLKNGIIGFGIGFPIIASVISLLLTAIPYKGFSYSAKYIRTTLLTTIALELIMSIMLLIVLLFTVIQQL